MRDYLATHLDTVGKVVVFSVRWGLFVIACYLLAYGPAHQRSVGEIIVEWVCALALFQLCLSDRRWRALRARLSR